MSRQLSGLMPTARAILWVAGMTATAASLGAMWALKSERIANLPPRVDRLEEAQIHSLAFQDTTRSYMRSKDERDERILCLLQSIADKSSPLSCERPR